MQRYGIVGFAGETLVFCPLTSDIQYFTQALDKIQIGKLEVGTSIGDGLMHSLEVLSHSRAIQRTIVLLTDGIQNSGKFDPLFASTIASQKGVRIVSLGLNSNEKAMAPFARKTNGGYIYKLSEGSKIDDASLLELTQKTNGIYLRVLQPTTFDQSLKQVLKTRNSEKLRTEPLVDQKLLDIYFERFRWQQQKE